jgi:hypothetical protein
MRRSAAACKINTPADRRLPVVGVPHPWRVVYIDG